MYRLNDIMIHDNDNCTDACGTATILNCNIRKWRLNATALSLRRKFFMASLFKNPEILYTVHVHCLYRDVICKLSATLCICGKYKRTKCPEETDFPVLPLTKKKKKNSSSVRFVSSASLSCVRNDFRTVTNREDVLRWPGFCETPSILI